MKVYVVICYDYSASGDNRFGDVYIFDSIEKANHFAEYECNGRVYDYAEVEEKEVNYLWSWWKKRCKKGRRT